MLAVSLVLAAILAVSRGAPAPQHLAGVTVADLLEKSSVQFSAFGRSFPVILQPLQTSLSTEQTAPAASLSHREGTVAGTGHSQVILSFFGESRVYGVIELEGGTSLERTFDLETTSSGALLLRERDVVHSSMSVDPAEASSGFHQADYVRSDATIPESEILQSRQRRSGPASSQHTACGVFLDIDNAFYNQWGVGGSEAERVQAAINKASSYLQSASSIYQSNYGSSIVLEIAGAYVYTTGNLGAGGATSAGSFLSSYSQFVAGGRVRGASNPTSQDVCLNVALTHRDFGSVVGVAYLADPDPSYAGGICSTYIGGGTAYNTAFVDSWGSRDLTIMSRGIAHEIGHAFGAEHVCCNGGCLSTGCDEQAQCDNPYIMFYMLSYGSNGATFPPCARSQMSNVIAAKGSCLTVPGSAPANPVPPPPPPATTKAAATKKTTKKKTTTTTRKRRNRS